MDIFVVNFGTYGAEYVTNRQGCTKAAIGAAVLDSILRRPSLCMSTTLPSEFSTVFFKEHHNKVASTWYGSFPSCCLFGHTHTEA
jgi:hypothetical protein